MSECDGKCSDCKENCSQKQSLKIAGNKYSKIKKVIGVVSGKGGVGKSFVTSVLASYVNKSGKTTAVLDADITGPSIPKAFGIHGMAMQNDLGILPAESANGIKIMSINLLLEDETSPVIWRGPVISGAVKQFWQDVYWGEIDYMFVDMPPGTGDVALTVFQSLPVDGIIVVTTPQDLVSMVVKKAYNMAKMMNVPILGLIENMSYVECPDCGKKINVFSESHIDAFAQELGIPVLAKLPIESANAVLIDSGKAEYINIPELKLAAEKLVSK